MLAIRITLDILLHIVIVPVLGDKQGRDHKPDLIIAEIEVQGGAVKAQLPQYTLTLPSSVYPYSPQPIFNIFFLSGQVNSSKANLYLGF